jgi:ATP adenylyltransferase
MTPLEQLWNGWRAPYLKSAGGVGVWRPSDGSSVFTSILGSGLDDAETNIVFRGRLTFAIMNLYPYSIGHLLVLPYREVADLELLTPDETVELWSTVTRAVKAVKAALNPGGLNVGINLGQPAGGSVPQHLHVHVVPRWSGDANFMTATANTRLLPEALPATAAKIRAGWTAV